MPRKYMCINESPWNCVGLHVSTFQKVWSVGVLALIFASLIVTSVMAMCRWVQITYPFKRLKKKRVMAVLMFVMLASVTFQVYSVFISSNPTVWVIQIMAAWTENPFLFSDSIKEYHRLLQIFTVFSVPLLLQILGLAASFNTIVELVRRKNEMRESKRRNHCKTKTTRRGSIKILVTNFGSVFFVITQMIGLVVQMTAEKVALGQETVTINSSAEAWMNFSIGYLVPMALSALNPIIFLILTPDAQRKNLFCIDKVEGTETSNNLS